MGICTRRLLLSVCVLQLISTVVRQVFDFLGYLWIPILVNFFEIIFIIFGFFGAFQYQSKYVISYSLWNLFLLGWNLFLVCLYLDVGVLSHQENKVLKLDPDSGSWWEKNGPGCKVTYNTTEMPKPTNVTDCVFNYAHVEVFHASLQCLLAFLGCITGISLVSTYLEKDSSSRHNVSRKCQKRTSLYSIEFSPQHDNRQQDSDSIVYGEDCDPISQPVSPKPMTPRRVKRRSVMTKGVSSHHSSSIRRYSGARSSARSLRRTIQNPVTQIIDQQQLKMPATSDFDCSLSASNLPPEPPPVYYNNISNNLLAPQQQTNVHVQVNGHMNPTYQQSSTQSLNEQDDLDDLYNNRPASVRSSYSNFHGTRVIAYNSPQYYHSHATPQVPQKRLSNTNNNKSSVRSTAFLKGGPPAYSLQGQNSVDSETTI